MNPFDWAYKFLRWGIGGIFIYAGGVKLLEPDTFALLIGAYGILPENLLMPVAVALPLLEVAAGLCLIFDIRGSLSAVAGLLVLFMVILGYGIRMGLDVDCGCFGPEDPEAAAFHGLRLSFHRDLAMFAGLVFIYGWRRYRAIEPVELKRFINKKWKKRRKEDAYV